MAHPFGDQDQSPGGGPSARPRPSKAPRPSSTTEPAPGEAASAAPQAEPAHSESPAGGETVTSHEAGTPPPPRPGRVKSFFTHCVAGLLGGLVGVAALALAWSHLDLQQDTTPPPDIAALEQRLAKLESAPAANAEQLAALKAQVEALQASGDGVSPELTALSDRVAKLEASLKALADTASDGGSVATAAAIAQQIAEAEQRLDAKIAAALAEGKGVTGSALEQMQTELAALKAKLGALAEAELGGGVTADLEPELATLTERIVKLETSLAEIVTTISKESAGAKSATVAIAFANLRAAVSDGRPYAAELDTISSLAPSVGDLGVLPAHAESGIPTLPELVRSFAAATDVTLAAPAPAAGGSLVDNLMASAQSLVKIRRVDEAPAGDGPAATLARAQTALDQGDLAAAVKEVETLDAPARENFSAWLGQAHARLGADETLTRLEGVLLVSMGGDAQTPQ